MGLLNLLFGRHTTQERPLVFKDNESAFEYSCKFMDCSIIPGSALPGIVLHVEPGKEGLQLLSLKVVSNDGGLDIPYSTTVNAEVPKLIEGDFVAFQVVEYDSSLPVIGGLIGFVVAKLEPILDMKQGWKNSS